MLKFSMLLINNNRSKAYLQNLLANGYVPEQVILLNDKNIRLPEHTDNDILSTKNTKQKFMRASVDLDISFDEKEHVLSTIEKHGINYILLDTLDINTKIVIDKVKNIPSEYIIYSGPGGTILRKELLSQGKKFLHVHPGWLPDYKGSTTIYYSMLIDSSVSASIIIFNEEIDAGPILYRQKYKIDEKNIDFDYVLDPLVRAKTLIEFFKKVEFKEVAVNENSNNFYIIHPLLKHLSILKHKRE